MSGADKWIEREFMLKMISPRGIGFIINPLFQAGSGNTRPGA